MPSDMIALAGRRTFQQNDCRHAEAAVAQSPFNHGCFLSWCRERTLFYVVRGQFYVLRMRRT